MKNLHILLACLLLFVNSLALADDTEIYGTTNVTNTVRPNVLLVVDNSGSMGAETTTYNELAYDPNINYSQSPYNGGYNSSKFYIRKNANYSDGLDMSLLNAGSGDYSCSDVKNTLLSTGEKLNIHAQQYRKKDNGRGRNEWRSINTDFSKTIRCNTGSDSYDLYYGNYLNYHHFAPKSEAITRMEAVKSIVKDLTYSLSNINLGMMRFEVSGEQHDGGVVEVALGNITDTAQIIRDTVANYSPTTWTPLTETLFEAQRYFSGGNLKYGLDSNPATDTNSLNTSNTSKYKSPVTLECQENHIIMLTDGDPSKDQDSSPEIEALVSGMTFPSTLKIDEVDVASNLSANCNTSADSKHEDDSGWRWQWGRQVWFEDQNKQEGNCMPELAYYMSNADQVTTGLEGSQTVKVHTIGAFGGVADTNYLKRVAAAGGGSYHNALSAQDIKDDIEAIVRNILQQNSSFTAPAISVNAFNNSGHRDELFYALFKPDNKARWAGNLKKYKLNANRQIVDKNTNLAVDPLTGFFNETSQDFWSTEAGVDGSDVTTGGVANLLEPANRTIYSDNSGSLANFNSVANSTTLNVPSDEVAGLKNWVKGYADVTNDSPSVARHYIGDPLHSEPVVVTYGGTDANPDSTVYFGTNEGFIHAINANTGAEQFAFLPKALHGIQNTLYENTISADEHPYGMDGPITSWMYDLNANNIIYNGTTREAGEHVYLYAGMRRGGSNYYGLDISDRSNPSLLFNIEGGPGGTEGFEKLGQTWSRMTVAKVKFKDGVTDDVDNGEKFVLLFAGGYDENQDTIDITAPDTIGNAIYMVDATTGDLLWRTSNATKVNPTDSDANLIISGMDNSMPASISAVDITGNGFIDYFFAVDIKGQVFRFDINQNNSGASDFATGGIVASLSGTATADKRRFYNKPNVAFVKNKYYGDYLTISIGSGHRAHPVLNNTAQDRFYVIKDFNPYTAPKNADGNIEYTSKTHATSNSGSPDGAKIYDASSLMSGGISAYTTQFKQLMTRGGGWYVDLPNTGEKVLAESTTFAGAVIFTTFTPSDTAINTATCQANTGNSRIYALDQINATSVIDLDGDGVLEASDTSSRLTQPGIAPRAIIIHGSGGKKTVTTGTETIEDDRFNETPPDPDCEANNSCPDPSKEQICSTGNCYVIPQYWRQNETTH